MSGRIVGEVIAYSPQDLTRTEWSVLIVLAESARDKDRRARDYTARQIADRARIGYGTARNTLAALAQRGLIRPLNNNVHRGGMHQEYEIARLETHHRYTTIRDTNTTPNVSPPNDTSTPERVTPQ